MFHTVDRTKFEYSPEVITAEASEIGLQPGYWPDFIAILDENNEGFLVQLERIEKAPDGDAVFAVYFSRTESLPSVRIYND